MVSDLYPAIYLRYKCNLASMCPVSTKELNHVCGIWICGSPRCGKDYAVRQSESLYVKSLNKW